jgi:AraC-like DNA-binding protein
VSYAEFPPPPRLARFVHCLWTFASATEHAVPERIVPDGRPELVVHCARPYREVGVDGALRAQPRALFAGQLTRPLHLRAAGAASVVGVRFRPDGARASLGRPMRECADARIALDDVWVGSGTRLADAMTAQRDGAARLALAEAFVAERIGASSHGVDEAVACCVAMIEASHGQVAIDALLQAAGLGRRQLERRFADAVGVGPALLAAIFRFRSAFDLLEHGGVRPWTDAALGAGFYDQSHFIREFRRFVGCTPGEFFRDGEGLATALVER